MHPHKSIEGEIGLLLMNGLPWYALRVRPRFEKMVASTLLMKGYEGFLPLYRNRRQWSDRVKEVMLPLFSGYMFCRLDLQRKVPVMNTPGVIQIVGIGRTPHPVADEEIEALQSIVISGLRAEPSSYFRVGESVRIAAGPLAGVEGIVIGSKGARKLVVSVTLLRRSVAVNVEESWLIPVAPLSHLILASQRIAAD
jgi:transcription antitermination factor NusG